jgi:Arm domain-containing DNA-binding protein/integrase-like protein
MPNPADEISRGANRVKITKRTVVSLAPRVTTAIWYDQQLKGFGVRVMPSGRRVYFVRYRNKHGRSRWFTIGEHGRVTADAARVKAQQILQAVAVDGSDPSVEREAFRAAPTVNELLDRYLAEHVEKKNKPSTRATFKGIIERDIRPELGLFKVAAVTRQDLHRFHAARANTPYQANLILAVCSKAFSLAELWQMRPDGSNPCAKIERYRVTHRERFLSAEELGRLGGTLRQAETAGLPWKSGGRTIYRRITTGAIELLLFTGCRLSEVLGLRWGADRLCRRYDCAARDEIWPAAGGGNKCSSAPSVEGVGVGQIIGMRAAVTDERQTPAFSLRAGSGMGSDQDGRRPRRCSAA